MNSIYSKRIHHTSVSSMPGTVLAAKEGARVALDCLGSLHMTFQIQGRESQRGRGRGLALSHLASGQACRAGGGLTSTEIGDVCPLPPAAHIKDSIGHSD